MTHSINSCSIRQYTSISTTTSIILKTIYLVDSNKQAYQQAGGAGQYTSNIVHSL